MMAAGYATSLSSSGPSVRMVSIRTWSGRSPNRSRDGRRNGHHRHRHPGRRSGQGRGGRRPPAVRTACRARRPTRHGGGGEADTVSGPSPGGVRRARRRHPRRRPARRVGDRRLRRHRAISPARRSSSSAYADPRIFERAYAEEPTAVLKRATTSLLEEIRRWSPARRRSTTAPEGPGSPASRLTPREISILELIAEGLTNREIADRLCLAEKTIKNYVSNLLAKMGVRHRAAAAAHLVRLRAAEEPVFPPSDWSEAL